MEQTKMIGLFWWLSALFVVLLILSNLIAARLIEIGGLILPSAIVVFPVTYVIGDIITEIFGFKPMRTVVWAALLLNSVFIIVGLLAISLPAPFGAENIAAYDVVFGFAPRILLASMVAFFFGSITSSFVLDKMKLTKRWNKFLFSRIAVSTLVGQLFDTCLFILIAFVGLLNTQTIFIMIIVQFSVKVIYEILFSPLTIMIIKKIRRKSGLEI